MRGKACKPGENGKREGLRTTARTMQPFKFAGLHTHDNDDLLTSQSILENIGVIRVDVYRILPILETDYRNEFRPSVMTEVGPIHERSKKAGSHCVSLGDTKVCSPRRTLHTRLLDPQAGPFATFIFRYRPLALLQANGIALNGPPPVPSSSLRKRRSEVDAKPEPKRARLGESSSQARNNELVDRKPDVRKLARTASEQEVIDLTGIKREREHSPIYLGPLLNGQIIDLTLDDD